MKVRKAVIPCAGFGTRFLPATKVVAKELLPIVDTPALCYIVEEAQKSGIEEVMIVVSPQKEEIKRLFVPNKALNERLQAIGDEVSYALANRDFGVKIHFVTQTEMSGNANAISLCEEFADGEPIAVLFGDDVMYTDGDTPPVTRQLIDAYQRLGATIVGCQSTSEEVARRCGVMIADGDEICGATKINGIVEKPLGELPSNLVSLGRFVLAPGIFKAIKNTGETRGEKYLTDAISILAKQEDVYAYKFDAKRYDIGNREGYLEATVEFALRDERLKDSFERYLHALK